MLFSAVFLIAIATPAPTHPQAPQACFASTACSEHAVACFARVSRNARSLTAQSTCAQRPRVVVVKNRAIKHKR
jgi:hypothetical protein